MADDKKRIQSYDGWRFNSTQSSALLSQAGFFYTGIFLSVPFFV